MIFEVYPAGMFQANCYIIGDEESRKGAVIDPGGDPDGILKLVEKLGLKIEYIILTHGHGDHIAGVYKIKEETGARILLNKKDEYLTRGGTLELIPILRNMQLFEVDGYVQEGDVIRLGEIDIHVLETPGHTPGSVSLWIDNKVLTGDALFQGSVGRTDFPQSSHEQLMESIKAKLLVLPEDTKVYPGHGSATTIAMEKKYNPFLR